MPHSLDSEVSLRHFLREPFPESSRALGVPHSAPSPGPGYCSPCLSMGELPGGRAVALRGGVTDSVSLSPTGVKFRGPFDCEQQGIEYISCEVCPPPAPAISFQTISITSAFCPARRAEILERGGLSHCGVGMDSLAL